MLDINDFSLSFGDKKALDSICLSIAAGEKVAIIGSSGSGKSTLIRYIYDQLQGSAAYCSQQQGLVESLSVFHNIYMGALGRNSAVYNLFNLAFPFKKPLKEVTTIANSLALDCPISQTVSQLSGGQRQRTAVGRAIYQKMPIFIGDEPFSALDPVMGKRLISLVLQQHKSVIMVLHDMDMALQHFDRVIGLRDGKKCIDTRASELSAEMLQAFYEGSSIDTDEAIGSDTIA
ncbi:phosphonate ABC transporter ATP-binding protein [Shewanella sp. Choline-02u-19]|uniref:ATP-binding cassette domain-containing protein n=1 Tax=unclassified Shewanella TaxID=196818 RepID=UPI000C3355E5|nr:MULTISPECIES: ATP-binding cassette domain-containing protein [unclassified Shewanella]PKG75476.1 phosphonate ABC transporter ATP-binding protein [Shewanella sp. GutCb]PKH56103.1 phosphonate ABC transporter ATP-binding protein [Shewanella sp. Bg11-22]PKI27257.1 phosphonate ABC transporter ATP-binding protein [Shewanella sp. Choline-02u-19]